ncbi:protein Wiz isoform X7 [Sminthopsis crassicaudata]|uniref:protein Wiz isoform X7 n=1 Tax=Sminthopsis crassicaudata TaxID=9301 RepID=UPI003D6991AF
MALWSSPGVTPLSLGDNPGKCQAPGPVFSNPKTGNGGSLNQQPERSGVVLLALPQESLIPGELDASDNVLLSFPSPGMEGPPGGGTAPPPRPAVPERPPSLVLRSESEEDVEAEDGEEGSPVSALYPVRPLGPRSLEGLRDLQDNDGVADGPPHHGLGDTLPSASAATTAHRSSSRYRDGGGAEFPLGSPPLLLLGRFPSPSDGRGSRAPWERPFCVDRGADVREESTLERPSSSREAGAPFCSQETSFVSESKAVHTVKTHTELGGGPELRGAPEIAAESPVPLGSWEDRHPTSEPKPLDTFHREHLSKNKKGILRFDWFSDPDEHAHYREKGQGLDSGVGQAMRAQPLREAAPPLALPGFRKSPAPGLGKIRTLEAAVVTERKGLLTEPEVSERSPLPEPRPEWVLPRPGLQTGPELAISKQTWTVNEEDSVERLSLEPPPCGPYDIEMRPYFCNLVEEADKEALGQEEDPAVYTCIECSIYFKKKEHLLDHMMQHSRGPGQDPIGDSRGGQGQFSCSECGWAFGDPGTLEQHRRLHQESREKIIEEIQKLNEFPDEGRDARLQCPKCVFGTNSSKIFVQHAKMHVRERRDQGAKGLGLSCHSGGEAQDSPGHLAYKHFRSNEPPLAQGPPLGLGKGLHSCILCGFPAPNENVLKEHVKYAHSHQPWGGEIEAFEDLASQPGTSRDSYSPARLARIPDVDYFGKADRLFAPAWQEGSAHYDPTPAFALGHQRLDRSSRVKKGFATASFHSRKMLPYSSTHKSLGTLPFSSAKVYNPYTLHPSKKKSMAHLKDLESDVGRDFFTGWEELRPPGSYTSDLGNVEEEMSLTTEIDFPQNRSFNPITIPQPALELKRTFREALQKAESSEAQQHQLRKMVPIVLVEEMNLQPPRAFQAHGRLAKSQGAPSSTELMLDGPIPLDLLLLDSPLEGPLGIDDLFDSDSPMLKNEERKCPYCPDRFHNGIGLANHVRGHLNRVGVSYNVRHFISAEEVKAIEQKFSFQKKKKKGIANFDPSTFSLMRCEFCGAGFDTRAGLSSHARAHLRDFGITNWELTISPINILKELLAASAERPVLVAPGPGEPGSPGCEREMLGFGPPSLMTLSECRGRGSPLSPFPQAWGDELGPIYRDVLASEEEEMVAMELASPPLPKKSLPPGQLDQTASRLGNKMSPEIPHGSKQEPPDLKAQNLTTCEVCGACFETRKGLSSHARSHLRQLGVAESESSGAPIDLLYELMKQKGKPDSSPLPLPLAKKSGSPKEATASPRPGLLTLSKAVDRSPDIPINKAIKSPPGFSSKGLSHPPGSPLLKKVPPALSGSPPPKNPEDKSPKLPLSPLSGSPKAQWPQPEDEGPLNLSELGFFKLASGPEPVRDIRCEFCGEFFENRKGLSSHARSHLRQMGVTEWYVNGSPIDTLREILKRRTQPRAGGPPNPTLPGPKGLAKAMGGGPGSSLEARSASELHVPPSAKKLQPSSSPLGHSPTTSPPPTARKMFPGLPPPSLQKKLKPDQMRMEIKREMLAGSLHSEGHPSDGPWSPREDMAPLNLSSRAEPVRDIRCEFCGEFFENRKGLSSHARSHLRQMGVTEWSVNGSPIDTLREILKKKAKPCLIKKEPATGELPSPLGEDGPKSPGKVLQALSLTPLPGRPGKPGPGSANIPREMTLSPLATKPSAGFLTPLTAKRPLPDDRLLAGELKPKTYIQTELPFKTKTIHDKSSHTSSEACCELCGLYFENRKALASHARAHLRQFGVTEWCVNGSPIETLSEWIKHRPQKVGAYRSYIQGGRPFTKKFRNSGHGRDGDKRVPLTLAPNSLALMNKHLGSEFGPGEASRTGDGGERPLASSPLALVKAEEHQRQNINKFERRQARPLDATPSRGEEASDFQQKLEEVRQPPPRVRPVPSLVPRPPQTSLVKFVGNIYTLKCRFCEVEFQGPLSIQEEWVRHLQRHILEMNFSKAEPRPVEPEAPEAQTVAEAQ